MVKTRLWQKITLILFGALISFGVLEVGMRLCGVVFLSMQEHRNLKSLKQTGAYRILCIGESTTQEQYPKLLERILNERIPGARFSVIDKGRAGAYSRDLLAIVETQLDEYRPNVVVAMMGINDKGIEYYQDIPEAHTWIFEHVRVYRFCRMLLGLFLRKVIQKNSEGSNVAGANQELEILENKALGNGALAGNADGSEQLKDNELLCQKKMFEKVIETDPTNVAAYVRLGVLYRDIGDFYNANVFFQKALAISPEDGQACAELAELLRHLGILIRLGDCLKKFLS